MYESLHYRGRIGVLIIHLVLLVYLHLFPGCNMVNRKVLMVHLLVNVCPTFSVFCQKFQNGHTLELKPVYTLDFSEHVT